MNELPALPDDGLENVIQVEPAAELDEFEAPVCLSPDVTDQSDWEDRLCAKLNQYFKYYSQNEFRLRQEDRWVACDRAYIGWVPNMREGNFSPRETCRQVETLIPQLSKALVWADQLFTLKPRLEGFEAEAQAATDIVHDQLRRYGSLKELETALIYDAVRSGIGYVIPGWEHFKQTRHKHESMHAENEPDWFERTSYEVRQEAPVFRRVSPWDIYCDPTIDEAKNSPLVFYVRVVSGADLKTMIRNGWLDADAVRKAIPEGDDNGGLLGDAKDDFGYLEMLPDSHTLKTVWSVDGWEYVMLDDAYILRAMPLDDGKIPIITSPGCLKQPGEHYGLPVAMVILGEQNFLNEIANLYVKNAKVSAVGGMVAGTPEACKAWNNALLTPGVAIPLNNPGDLQPLALSKTMGDCQQMMGYTTNSMSRANGLPDVVGGTGTSGTNTATGLTSLQRAAGDRIQQMVHLIQPSFIEAYGWGYNLNAANMDRGTEYPMRIAGPDGVEVFKRYSGKVFNVADVDVEVSLTGAQGIEIANFWLNVAKNANGTAYINMNKIWEEVFKAAGIKRVKSFFTSGLNQQEDALKETFQVVQTGILADPRPMDNHEVHLAIHNMALGTMPQDDLVSIAALKNHIAIHMQFIQQQQIANGMQQQAPASLPNPGATPAGQQGNDMANSMFDMGQMGANQQGAT